APGDLRRERGGALMPGEGRPPHSPEPGEPGRRRPGTGPRRGFTLVELVVAFVVLAVMAAMAAPAFLASPRPPAALDDAQGRLQALFRLARDSAVRSATPVTVVIDSASGRVWLDARARLSDDLPFDAAGSLA